jgi:hypothetical protein
LRFDTMPSRSKLAGMAENGLTIALHMLVKPNAGASLGHDGCERGLANLKRITPQIVPIQRDEVQGVEEYALVSTVMTDEIERGNAVVTASDSLQERERRRANVSTISGKRRVRSLPGRL